MWLLCTKHISAVIPNHKSDCKQYVIGVGGMQTTSVLIMQSNKQGLNMQIRANAQIRLPS